MSAPRVIVEPTFLVFDSMILNTTEKWLERVETINKCTRMLNGQLPIGVVIPNDVVGILGDAGFYPMFDHIQRTLSSMGLSHVYSAQDVLQVFGQLIQRAGSLEEAIGVEEVLYEGPVNVEPGVNEAYRGSWLEETFVQVMGQAAAGISLNRNLAAHLTVLSSLAGESEVVSVSGRLYAVEPRSQVFQLGEIVEKVAVCLDFESALLGFDGYQIWKGADDECELLAALTIGVYKYGLDNGLFVRLADIPKFSIGSEFHNSLRQHQGIGAGKYSSLVYNHSIAIICRKLGRDMANRERADGSIAKRWHLTGRHSALRLMYWIHNGCVELANIGPKSELVIEGGNGHPIHFDPSKAF